MPTTPDDGLSRSRTSPSHLASSSPRSSDPRAAHGFGLNGFLPLNGELSSPMTTVGHGVLTSLVQPQSPTIRSRASRPREQDEEAAEATFEDGRDSWDHIRTLREDSRRNSLLMTPQVRSMRLIGNSNPRYRWEQYWKTEEELKAMSKPLREYYTRTNSLIQQYIYIDRLLDSSIPHNLLNEYGEESQGTLGGIPSTITEEPRSSESDGDAQANEATARKAKRTPHDIFTVPDEDTPLLSDSADENGLERPDIPVWADDSVDSQSHIVQLAIYVNLAANIFLLGGKIAVIALTSSLSVLASLVDAALDFLSTAIVWGTTRMIARQDQYAYPIGRRRLEPIGVLVFSVIMITAFCQVALECLSRLSADDHSIIELGKAALIIMASTIVVKGLCWLWCRLINNSSVQALAQDAVTDIIFNLFSIIFPVVGFYAHLWWLDALGGLLLSLFVIINWARTSSTHIRNLTGAAATPDERNVLLYLTMRFAKTIKQIQGLQAYHSGDKLNVEVDIVLDENTNLRDSHDLGESLQYVLESVPIVDRAFVHQDYASYNLPSHLQQQA